MDMPVADWKNASKAGSHCGISSRNNRQPRAEILRQLARRQTAFRALAKRPERPLSRRFNTILKRQCIAEDAPAPKNHWQ